MSIFSRLGDIIAANVSDMIEKAEDPAKMIRLIVLEMEETLVEVRASAARTIADQKEARRTLNRLQEAQTGWGEKAELALSKGRDDLAKAALVEKQKLSHMADELVIDLATLEENFDKHGEDIQALEAKLREARTRQQTIMSRLATAENRIKMRKLMTSSKVDEAFSRFDMLERRVDLAEGRVEAYDVGRKHSLEAEINQLAHGDAIDAELARMKAKLSPAKKD